MEDLKSKLEQSTEAENRANDTIKQMEMKLSEEIDKSESLKIDFAQSDETIRYLQSNASKLEETIEKLKKEHEEVTKTKFEIIFSNFSCRFLSPIFSNYYQCSNVSELSKLYKRVEKAFFSKIVLAFNLEFQKYFSHSRSEQF